MYSHSVDIPFFNLFNPRADRDQVSVGMNQVGAKKDQIGAEMDYVGA